MNFVIVGFVLHPLSHLAERSRAVAGRIVLGGGFKALEVSMLA